MSSRLSGSRDTSDDELRDAVGESADDERGADEEGQRDE